MIVEMQPICLALALPTISQLGRGRLSHRSPEMQAPQGQLPPSTEHPSPPTTYHQHPSPPTQPPHTTSDLPMTYSQPLAAPPGSAYPSYSTSATANHFPVSSTISDSEQRMVSELITSISNDLPPQQCSSTPSNTTTACHLCHQTTPTH